MCRVVDKRCCGTVALVVVHAYFDSGSGTHAVGGFEFDISGVCEVAFGHVVWAFVEVYFFYDLRHQEVQVGIALAVGMADHVDWHAVDGNVDVGAVVKVEAAQKQLFGFASAGVLGYKQAWHDAQHFLR